MYISCNIPRKVSPKSEVEADALKNCLREKYYRINNANLRM